MAQPKRYPNTHQVYGVDADGNTVHCGPHVIARVNAKTIQREHRKWSAWRATYLAENPGDYPLRHCPKVVALHVWPIGKENAVQVFVVA